MLWKCCTQYASKFGKLSSGHRTGKGEFSFQFQRKAMPKNTQTTAQLHSSHMLVRRRQWHPTPVLLPRKSHGRRSLVGCSPWGHYESDTAEQLHFHFSLLCIGEGNATHSSVLAWRIPGTGEPGGLPSIGSHRVGHYWSDLAAAAAAAHASKVMLKILQARLQQYVNCELPDVQAGF